MKPHLRSSTQTKQIDPLIEARRTSVSDFGSIEHRLEYVQTIDGIEYINDSKATDVNSTWYSLEYMNKPIVWIVGASEFETDYSIFSEIVTAKVKAVICLGKNREDIFDSLIKNVELFAHAATVQEAAEISISFACKDDVVLFSPACSSFDMFQNYQDRGNQFKTAVAEIGKKGKKV